MSDLDLFSQIRQLVRQEVGDIRSFKIGIVDRFDPISHTVVVQYPGERDRAGNVMRSPQIRLLSPWVGAGYGMQVHPVGGELCLVAKLERAFGNAVAIAFMFSDAVPPPAMTTPLSPGDAVVQHPSGSMVMLQGRDIRIFTPELEEGESGSIYIDAGSDVHVTAKSNVNIEAKEDVTVKAEGKLNIETSEINIDAGDKKLTVNIQAKDDVDVNATDLSVTVNSKNATVNSQEDIYMNGKNITLHATQQLRLEGDELTVTGSEIIIGNQTNADTRCGAIRIDAVQCRTVGRIKNRFLGTRLAIGATAWEDGFYAQRIDIKTGGPVGGGV